MNMRRFTLVGMPLILSVAVMVLAVGCNTEELECCWTPHPIETDGLAADWKGIPTTFFEEENVAMGISNDSSRLHILFRHRDPMWAGSIRMSGLTIWIDKNGGKDKDFMIRYRGGPTREEITAHQGLDSDSSRLRSSMFQQNPMMTDVPPSEQFTCMQKDRIIEMPVPMDGSNGPAACYATDRGFFTYEFSVPLQESVVRYYGLGAQPGQKIGIGAEFGSMNRENRPKFGSSMDGGRPTSGGGGMGGGPPGGGMGRRGGGGPGGGMKRPEKQEIWINTTLADAVEEP